MRKKAVGVEVLEPVEDELYKNVRSIIVKARAKVYVAANTALVKAYWDVGREIVEKQGGEARSRYGDGLVARLSLKLTAEFGPGYNKVNLFYMRRFFLAFPKVHTLCKQLNWSHDRTLIAVEDSKARAGADAQGRQSADRHRAGFGAERGGDPLYTERPRAQSLRGQVPP